MKAMWNITRLFRRAKRSPGAQPEDFRVLDAALEHEARYVRSVDPETASQWRVLHGVLEQKDRATVEVHVARRRQLRFVRPAVAFAITAVVLLIAGRSLLEQPATMSYETARGQVSTLLLADSSTVMLNHTSKLHVDLRPREEVRHVTLTGEAYFRVQKSEKPFVVSTDVGTVRVLGTEFNVRVRNNLMEVAVIRGKVNLGVEKEGRDSSVILTAGEITRSAMGEFPATPVRIASAEYPGWIHGKLLFLSADLSTVCREIEEMFDVTVKIGKPHLLKETITGALDARSADAALATLARLTGSTYRNENGVYTLF